MQIIKIFKLSAFCLKIEDKKVSHKKTKQKHVLLLNLW